MHGSLSVITVVVVGVMVGVEFAVAVLINPIFDRLPDGAGLAARSDGARLLGRVMPFWYIGSVLLSVLWVIQGWGRPSAGLVAVAAVLLVASVVISVVVLVPINSRVAQWSDGNAPSDWKAQVRRWDQIHYLRVVVIAIALVLLAVANSG